MHMLEILDIARLEESRVMTSVSEVAAEWRPWAGGRMCRGAPGLWCNVALGAGMSGPVTDDEVSELVDFYTSADIEPRIELCPFADESLRAALERAGFVLRMFEMVLVRELAATERAEAVHPAPADIEYHVVDPADDTLLRACAEVVIPGFKAEAGGAETLNDEEFEFFKRNARHPRCVTVAARLREPGRVGPGRIVAVGGCEIGDRVGALFGAVTVKDQRRRGIQQGLIAARLNIMARRGVEIATIGSRPHSSTQRNVRRMGFWHAYTKVALVKPGPGLTPIQG